eukprot:CAMPEP_0197043142 /NCGR_PEP_ID=MMETSP1384-20130603/19424_1 /TAXON_ID=29189 /ORGANISM="Ammonia sp." /LENGTH=344 /DNA_ID=CAMNT_0042474389 /DNA_START=90 /DNA_END=1124 /DNA_ORIENTATION=-
MKDIIESKGYRIQLLQKLGEGTYGVVYKARNLENKQILAVKKIRSATDENMEQDIDANASEYGFSTTTLREIALLKELSSGDNIVTFFDTLYCSKNRMYLLFEFVDNDLKQYMEKRVKSKETQRNSNHAYLSQDEIKCIMHQIMSGVAYCHSLHVFHRDLKPQNILIDEKTKQIKLADFGLARTFKYGYDYQRKGKLYTHEVITLWYRPCEILLDGNNGNASGNNQCDYSASIDIWSVACIFAEIANYSQPLFRGDSEISQLFHIFKICGTPNQHSWPNVARFAHFQSKFPKWSPVPVHKIVPHLDALGQDLFSRMLLLNPDKRITAKQSLRHPYFLQLAATKK